MDMQCVLQTVKLAGLQIQVQYVGLTTKQFNIYKKESKMETINSMYCYLILGMRGLAAAALVGLIAYSIINWKLVISK